jgi:hypothetical protein
MTAKKAEKYRAVTLSFSAPPSLVDALAIRCEEGKRSELIVRLLNDSLKDVPPLEPRPLRYGRDSGFLEDQ